MKYKLGYTEEECVAMEKEKRKGGGDRREGDGTMWQCMENPAALSAAVFHRSFQFRNALQTRASLPQTRNILGSSSRRLVLLRSLEALYSCLYTQTPLFARSVGMLNLRIRMKVSSSCIRSHLES